MPLAMPLGPPLVNAPSKESPAGLSGDEARRLAYVGLTRVKGDLANRSAFVTVVNSDFGLRSFQQRFEHTA